jgi:hypothetical protein
MKNITFHQWISESAYYRAKVTHFARDKALDDGQIAEHEYVKTQIARYLSAAEEDGAITILGLQQLAKSVGVKGAENLTLEIELVQAIQQVAYQNPCFRSEHFTGCHEGDGCQWRAECRKLIAEWCR